MFTLFKHESILRGIENNTKMFFIRLNLKCVNTSTNSFTLSLRVNRLLVNNRNSRGKTFLLDLVHSFNFLSFGLYFVAQIHLLMVKVICSIDFHVIIVTMIYWSRQTLPSMTIPAYAVALLVPIFFIDLQSLQRVDPS